ncbi:UDP-glucose/GDP-mannose dehydrogenase family protein [Candidatus Pacearchaeota archaeon]|nr:UDP-glucose/GDP-mannose dehydrogenase family protein [Candidatus Pacearchaeota archaeon]
MKKNIVVIGAGVVGRATGNGFLGKGHRVVFCDTSADVRSKFTAEGNEVCKDYDLHDFDVSMICVNTPTYNNRIQYAYLEQAIEVLGTRLADISDYHLVSVRCTMLPGTTEEMLIPMLEYYSQKKAGKDFGVCVNPEFLREVSAEDDFANPWLTVIGAYDKRSAEELKEMYEPFGADTVITEIKVAEMMKYAHNMFNATKISFFNEVHIVCQSLGIDSNAVVSLVAKSAEGMWNPEYGTKGGRPYGGTCLPKDTRAFRTFAHGLGLNDMVLLDAVIRVNEEMGEPVDGREKTQTQQDYAVALNADIAGIIT